MAKKNVVKKSVNKIGNLVSKEIQKATEQLQTFLGDLSKQTEELHKQVREPLKNFVKELEELRSKELKKLNDEYQRITSDLATLQEQLSDKLGIPLPSLRKAAPEASPSEQPAEPQPTVASPEVVKSATNAPAKPKAAAPAKTTTAKKTAAPKKAAAKPAAKSASKTAATKSTTNGDDLTKLTGIGPALAKKLNNAGITRFQQIATPNEADQQALAKIGKVKNSDKWQDEAKALLAQK